MTKKRGKPQGASGPIKLGSGGAEWQVIQFPEVKDERERLIARLFVKGFDSYVAMQSEPSLAPFGEPRQNQEDNLDFTVKTAQGDRLMELAEFAPLQKYGPQFADAPMAIEPMKKAALALELIENKSRHQGGTERFLALYATEQGFWLDPITIERLRRLLIKDPPQFDRVYYVSVHDLDSASVSEIYPGKPHHTFGNFTEEQLNRMRVYLPHPGEMIGRRLVETNNAVGVFGKPISRVRFAIFGSRRSARNLVR
jgi:hypothetical protein